MTAWRFHRLSTGNLLRRLGRDPRWQSWLAVTPDTAARRGRGLWPFAGPLIPQGPGDLGARMSRAFRRLPPGPVVIVGSDIPGIDRRHVAEAFEALGRHDFVVGPASDGGYWLIGARRRPALRLSLDGVRWGGPQALADTLAAMAGQSVATLETLGDVDILADLEGLPEGAWCRLISPPPSGAP